MRHVCSTVPIYCHTSLLTLVCGSLYRRESSSWRPRSLHLRRWRSELPSSRLQRQPMPSFSASSVIKFVRPCSAGAVPRPQLHALGSRVDAYRHKSAHTSAQGFPLYNFSNRSFKLFDLRLSERLPSFWPPPPLLLLSSSLCLAHEQRYEQLA